MLSHKTAKTRKTLSAPTKYLLKDNAFLGKVLDYGCGKGFDSDELGFEKYDPHFFPKTPKGKYDTIVCNYVLNVINNDDANLVIAKIRSLLKSKGKAYISVRRDIIKEGVTKSGTFQRNVILDLPVLVEVPKKFCIYLLTK